MTPLLLNLDSSPTLAAALCERLEAEPGTLETRNFPDGESYLRVLNPVQGREVIILCNLVDPDARTLRLIFLADTLRELGARRIGLVSPYLAYMRQDKRFQPGECVSSRPFAALLSRYLDWLVTMDPHLHRYHALDQIYSIPTRIVPAAPLIARWIRDNVPNPVLLGPDMESEQWVAQVAALAGAPFEILNKVRSGDYTVSISQPAALDQQRTPVLIDDIISSGRTMLQTIRHLRQRPVCIGVHGLFAADAYQLLQDVAEVVTTECVPHPSNRIPIAPALADGVRELLAR